MKSKTCKGIDIYNQYSTSINENALVNSTANKYIRPTKAL